MHMHDFVNYLICNSAQHGGLIEKQFEQSFAHYLDLFFKYEIT